jgi:G3E family GTPase
MEQAIPITVITGFLGSGKTTLLSALLKQKERDKTAVIINEFGEVGLDHALIERSEENIVELQNGCICCTIRGDLQETLLGLFDKMSKGNVASFDRVVIETTGLADPVPIIHTLMTSFDLQRIYTLDGVVTVVDVVNGEGTLDSQPESVKQAALAERIILSKTDIANDEVKESLIKRLEILNPSATIIPTHYGDIAASELFDLGGYNPNPKSQDVKEWLAAEAHHHTHDHEHHHHHDVNRHGEHIQAFSMTSQQPVSGIAFSFFLDVLAAQMGENLLRVKGIVNITGEDRPAVVHGVQHIFHPVQWLDRWPDEDHSTRLVCITRNSEKQQIEKLFHSLMGITEENATSTEVAQAWLKAS